MQHALRTLAIFAIIAAISFAANATFAQQAQPVIAIHGGAGGSTRGSLSTEREQQSRDALNAAAKAGQAVLVSGGSAVDAVVAAVKVLEDSPLFNAGKGAVFTSEGKNELDASIMDGKETRSGAVAGVRRVKNPIEAARAVMTKSRHVFFIGENADAFAKAQGLAIVEESYFATDYQLKQLERAKQREQLPAKKSDLEASDNIKYGTVGAVALDRNGNLAAATSTGGTTNKMPGRVGDSPIIGAGTYAENGVAAISATGTGEMFIRSVASYDVAARMKYAKQSASAAADAALAKVRALGGTGGFIVIDWDGNVTFAFNTSSMYRASATGDADPVVKIFNDE
jgi:L-asparaginase / beta-aspartyl-peptidase